MIIIILNDRLEKAAHIAQHRSWGSDRSCPVHPSCSRTFRRWSPRSKPAVPVQELRRIWSWSIDEEWLQWLVIMVKAIELDRLTG